ncbi:MAG: c-type cytochrome domain-containing protein, partial [Pirellulaceae bacterium]
MTVYQFSSLAEPRTKVRFSILTSISAFVFWATAAISQDGNASEPIDFDSGIAQIFKAHCTECHSADDDNGSLRLDASVALSAETDSGKSAIVAGEPDASELLRRVLSEDDDIRMPPDGERLTSEQIEILRAWIQEGAVWPDSGMTGAEKENQEVPGSNHWSFKPVVNPDLPVVRESGWARSPIDYFVQAQRESAGLSVASDASPQHLVRRVSYALTGLPPAADRVVEFEHQVAEAGDLSGALEGLVDEL